jgi:hypothetical protein
VFFDAVYFFCFLFACGHVGFFVYGGVGVKYRYGLACVWWLFFLLSFCRALLIGASRGCSWDEVDASALI